MKNLLLSTLYLVAITSANAQTINDNKVTFNYIQLPYLEIDNSFTSYELRVEHGYKQANQDSLTFHEANKKFQMDNFHKLMELYQLKVDSVDRVYYTLMSKWEQDVNAGKTQPDGTALSEPARPIYPPMPVYPSSRVPQMHSDLDESIFTNGVNVEGFEKGLGGFIIKLNILPVQNIRISESKKGTGTSTTYTFTARYVMPVELTVETPTQGKIISLRFLEGQRSFKIGDYKSRAAHKLYMLNNREQMFLNLEQSARTSAIAQVNNYLNDQIGYMKRSRKIEFYSVKKFKNHDYSDVTAAYTKSVQALQMVANDRDRAGAIDALDDAIAMWKSIMTESNVSDGKARINDKVTGMIQCNLAELYVWVADFNNADMNVNMAINSTGKFRRHINDEKGFYTDQRKRWEANF